MEQLKRKSLATLQLGAEMLDGAQFVAAVGRLGYPGASALKGEDFDWLFNSPEQQQFLRFLCSSVTHSNVLSSEEVQAYRALRRSGKPLLREEELEEALKACGVSGTQAASSRSGLQETQLEQLEQELQALRMEKRLKSQRLKRLQVLTAARSDRALRLASRQQDSACRLKDDQAALGAENAEHNAALQGLGGEVKWLAGLLRLESPPPLQAPPILLSQLSLQSYLQQEELNTKTLAQYTQKQFFPGISDLLDTSSRENFPLLDLSAGAEEDDGTVEAWRTEMSRLQWAHIVAQHQLLWAQSEECGTKAGLQWITQTLRGKAKLCASAQALQARELAVKQELQGLRGDLEALMSDAVPAALRESARLLLMPVVRGDLDLQLVRQEYYTSRQDQVCDALLRQKASFEVLLLALQLELRRGEQATELLSEMCRELGARDAALRARLHTFSQPELSLTHGSKPCSIISTKDTALSRLYRALQRDGEDAGGRVEPFRTYEGLESSAQELQEELGTLQDALDTASQEQGLMAGRLEGDCDLLRGVAYSGLQQLVLTPQVCATAELCPNAQELQTQLQGLESELQSLNTLIKDTVGDIQGKKALLDRSCALQTERALYVYFHRDEALLQRVVQDLEGSSSGRGQRS
ncbi:hypothetical protein GJAV_G00168450 [Gymnothorax javanicus]|nr:hypothetical protein GJAV_G00168450 [Gymnothorax javanicus]